MRFVQCVETPNGEAHYVNPATISQTYIDQSDTGFDVWAMLTVDPNAVVMLGRRMSFDDAVELAQNPGGQNDDL